MATRLEKMFSFNSPKRAIPKNAQTTAQLPSSHKLDFPGGSDGKASAYNVGDPDSIPGLERSPGEGNDNPLQYFCLENPINRGACQATVHGVAKRQDFVTK